MVAFIDIFKFYFIFVQTDCTKPERMGKRIISGVGCYFTIKFQINRTIRSVAVNTDFFIEMSDSLCIENGCYRTFSTGRYRRLSVPTGEIQPKFTGMTGTSVQPQEEVTFEITSGLSPVLVKL